ncbi:CapA family protein [Oscillatoria sp. FACHB-1407]|uniref:CapA family protein n=1 Tax=Oscillatoria sp. FACHB-1407 TaxID=2692847 RepID=UPI001683FA9C|nr:CapA family protein [Oscillatoria sp. FACHB-1407]MBD2461834.1 CapA family protein [Oscillatoria sp. FACHB-1407]
MVNLELAKPSVASIEELYQPSVMQMARAGHFRAIAYWINAYLVPQGIYVCVAAASRPGYLLILVEFQHAPDRERLVRFICHRLCKLKSDLIAGAQIVACYAGGSHMLWQQSVRLLAPGKKRRSRPKAIAVRRVEPLLPTLPKLDLVKTAHTLHEQVRQLNLQDHLTNPRLRLLVKSAAAAFILGCAVEVANSTLRSPETVTAEGITRPAVVETALEQVPVTQFEAEGDELNSTVTLAFSNEEALGAIRETSPTESAARNRISQPDVTLAYLNTPPTTPAVGAADPSAAIQALQADGVDVVNLANNALLQRDDSELTQAIETLEQAGIHSLGAGRNQQEARRPEIMDVRGQRIAYLGYSDSDQHAAGTWKAGVNPGLSDQVSADIQAIRDQVDWVVVNYHWNQELTEQPADWQMNLARTAIDQGADLVVGHHPDVLQGAEIYKGRAIAYSLGNFIFPNSENPASQPNYDTAMLKVSLRQNQMRLEFLPVQVSQDKPQIASGEKAEEILQRIRKASAQFEQPMDFPVTLDAQPPSTQPSAQPMTEAAQPATQPPVNTQPPIITQPPSVKPTSPESSFVEPPSGEPASLEPSTVEGTTPITAPSDEGTTAPANSFITYPDGSEQTPIDNQAIPKPTDPLKQEATTPDNAVQPVDAIPETAEIDVLPEPESEEILFPDELDPLAEPTDAEVEPLPGDGF